MGDDADVARPSAVLLDLDGTLVDSLDDIALALGRALVAHGLTAQPRERVAAWVGHGARSLVARALELPADAPRVAEVLARYLAEYARDATPATRWMPGAEAFLDRLRAAGIPAVLCTNKPRAIVDAMLAGFLDRASPTRLGRFAAVIAAGDVPRLKPDPMPLQAGLAAVSADAASAWMIGDSPPDALAAHAAGVRSAIYLRGYGRPEAIAEAAPDATFDDFAALAAIVGLA
jgi:phosphoglycolate phosphatase